MNIIGPYSLKTIILGLTGFLLLSLSGFSLNQELDEKVQSFLESHRYQWRDMNVPQTDGRILYDIIVENGYTRALEIGTSTGHSGIWIAWALSKTGGKLITVEIDKRRYQEAQENFKEAGLSDYIDARLADAHELVPELKGPFDFVFIDADKGWYTNYVKAVIPKLKPGGCIAAHNVYHSSRSRWGRRSGTSEYYEFMQDQEDFETSILPESRSGVSVSYKKK
ncbi:MAG TPA: class I SAM-dependent methyltransferase [Acidobacteriota bacterium]|nr:class I SAM-dependent methyltransferase [Acidobacteriota bacterium]